MAHVRRLATGESAHLPAAGHHSRVFGEVGIHLAALSLGPTQAHRVRGAFTGRFPLETQFGFRIGGIVAHEFFSPHALTLDFGRMRYALHASAGA